VQHTLNPEQVAVDEGRQDRGIDGADVLHNGTEAGEDVSVVVVSKQARLWQAQGWGESQGEAGIASYHRH